jgi:hypothetical protein
VPSHDTKEKAEFATCDIFHAHFLYRIDRIYMKRFSQEGGVGKGYHTITVYNATSMKQIKLD